MTGQRTVFRLGAKRLRWKTLDRDEESRHLATEDPQHFAEWSARYRRLLQRPSPQELLVLGQDVARWLDGSEGWVQRGLEALGSPPWVVEFTVPARPGALHVSFLEAPWELLALDGEYLAGREDVLFAPLRRLGRATETMPASPYRLTTIFMAAAPQGTEVLSYEAEETAILDAAGHTGMDLTVEESGNLELLEDCIAEVTSRTQPATGLDVLHLSCHGKATPAPVLFLEDSIGEPDPTDGRRLIRVLSPQAPRLLVLSACESGALGQQVATLLPRAVALLDTSPGDDRKEIEVHVATRLTYADDLRQRGELEKAQEQLMTAEKLLAKHDFVHERAITLLKIADIFQARGELDEALRIRKEEALPIFEKLGDVRERAITLGKIADIFQARGELDEALRIRKEEELPVFEKLGDVDSRARALWQMARIAAQQQDLQTAVDLLAESYQINLKLGRLDGIAMVGRDFGQLLCSAGHLKEGRVVLERSRAGFLKLGLLEPAEETAKILNALPEESAEDE